MEEAIPGSGIVHARRDIVRGPFNTIANSGLKTDYFNQFTITYITSSKTIFFAACDVGDC